MSVCATNSSAERQRRYRRRQREGVFLAQVELRPEDIEALIAQGYLGDDDATNPRRVGAAVLLAAKIVLSRYGHGLGESHRLAGAARTRSDHDE